MSKVSHIVNWVYVDFTQGLFPVTPKTAMLYLHMDFVRAGSLTKTKVLYILAHKHSNPVKIMFLYRRFRKH